MRNHRNHSSFSPLSPERTSTLWPLALAVASVVLALPPAIAADDRPPNLVILLADDLGWADLACYGNQFNKTPNIDRLAREGIRFTQFYAGPVCSPTRANMQSGQDQARFGITQHIPGHRRPYALLADPKVADYLPLEVETFAESLAAAGYRTGYFGKWHLGDEPRYGPAQQGWQEAVELRGHQVPASVTGTGHSERTIEFLTRRAIAFMEANRERPFLLQVSHTAVHIPLTATPEWEAQYRNRPRAEGYPSRADYAGFLAELDESVGQVAAAIDRLGLAENTLLLFVSDNGGLEHEQNGTVVTSNLPLRGEKGTLYEGGIRVPAIARWPGTVPAGAVCNTPLTTIDLHPTFRELAGGLRVSRAGQTTDGASFAEVLREPSRKGEDRPLFWHLPHYHHSTPASAIRFGDWKLIEFFEDDHAELYNLADDPGEQENLASQMPAKAQVLLQTLGDWRTAVGAQMPAPNANYDPARANQLGTGEKTRAAAKRQPRR